MLIRCIGWRKQKREDHILSYGSALLRTNSERVETTVRRRWLLCAGFVTRMGEERLPQREEGWERGRMGAGEGVGIVYSESAHGCNGWAAPRDRG